MQEPPSFRIMENRPLAISFGTLETTDADIGTNAIPYYFIIGNT